MTVLQMAGELKSDLIVEVVREYKHFEGEFQDRDAQTTDARSPWRLNSVRCPSLLNSLRCPSLLNFLRWSVSSVGPQYETSITSPFCRQKF